ncbi:MAG: PepSY domain-containing protein [Deltaproteobacteria bacterium]|jgi:uncharacterized membrane protein YkoI
MKRRSSLHLFTLGLLVACGGATTNGTSLSTHDLEGGPFDSAPEVQDRASAEARAVALFGGDVISSKLDVERGLSVFEIKLLLPSSAVIEVSIEESTGHLVQVEHESGPLTDDLPLGDGFLNLAEALAKATGDVVDYELELDDGLRWVWELELADGTSVKVDAQTGEVFDGVGDDSWDDDGFDDGQAATPTDAIRDAALAIVDGEVVKSEREFEHGMSAWKLTIRTASGASVEVYLLADDASLLRVKDDEGPFDYAVTPGRGWLTLDEAVERAGRSLDVLSKFRLDRSGQAFVYELDFGDEDVDVNAVR